MQTNNNDNKPTILYSKEAEQAILGAVMQSNRTFGNIQEKRLTVDDFYIATHRLIFAAIVDMLEADTAADYITVTERLKSHGQLDKTGGESYLIELIRNTPAIANLNTYIEVVQEKSILRSLRNVAQDVIELTDSPEGRSSHELIDIAEQKIFSISDDRPKMGELVPITSVVSETIRKIQDRLNSKSDITGLATGFTDLDKNTGGFHPGDFIVIAGRPSMGKTAFAVNIAQNSATVTKQPIAIFSLEMPANQISLRILSTMTKIDQSSLKKGHIASNDWGKLVEAVSTLKEQSIYIDDTPGISPGEMRARLRRIAKSESKNIALIVVDYLQLMRIPGMKGDNRVNEISEISRNLKAMAKEFNCPIIALSQLNRSLENRHDKRPMNSDLRESGAIEQDADLILFVYREEYYYVDKNEKGEDVRKNQAEVIIGKNRNGPTDRIKLKFNSQWTEFVNLDEKHTSYPENENTQNTITQNKNQSRSFADLKHNNR